MIAQPRLNHALLVVLAAAGLCSCGLLQKRLLSSRVTQLPPQDADKEALLGSIESVNPEQQFVLVRMDARVTVLPGTKLEARSPNGLTTTLVVSPEKKLSFLSADIEQGLPQPGDLVFVLAQPAPAPSTPQPADPATPPPDLPMADGSVPGAVPTNAPASSGEAPLPPPVQ